MDYIIRQISANEIPLMEEFLYHAIFKRDSSIVIPRSILEKPELQVYTKDFGKYKDDFCLCAYRENKAVGMAWVRNIQGYGSIDEHTPELAISVLPNYRKMGIGTKLLGELLRQLCEKGYKRLSLAVQKENYALRMYQRAGFEIIDQTHEEYIMLYKFN